MGRTVSFIAKGPRLQPSRTYQSAFAQKEVKRVKVHAPEEVLTPDFAKSLVRFATLRTGSVVLDEDLVQEALLRGVQAFRRTAYVVHPVAFFSKIVKDTVRDHWRRQHVLQPLESISQHRLAYVQDLDGMLDHKRRVAQIHEALHLLPARQQQLINLFYFEELSLGELSAILGQSQSALKMALLRARSKIVTELTRRARSGKKQIRRIHLCGS